MKKSQKYFLAFMIFALWIVVVRIQSQMAPPTLHNLDKFGSIALPESFKGSLHSFRMSDDILYFNFINGEWHDIVGNFHVSERMTISLYADTYSGNTLDYLTRLKNQLAGAGEVDIPSLVTYSGAYHMLNNNVGYVDTLRTFLTPIKWKKSFIKEGCHIDEGILGEYAFDSKTGGHVEEPNFESNYSILVFDDPTRRIRIFYQKKGGSYNKMLTFVLDAVNSLRMNPDVWEYFAERRRIKGIDRKTMIANNIADINTQLSQKALPAISNDQSNAVVTGPYVYRLTYHPNDDIRFELYKVLGTTKPSSINSVENYFICSPDNKFKLSLNTLTELSHRFMQVTCTDHTPGLMYVFETCTSDKLSNEQPFNLLSCLDKLDRASLPLQKTDPNFQKLQ